MFFGCRIKSNAPDKNKHPVLITKRFNIEIKHYVGSVPKIADVTTTP